jgi:hypothetical protein
VGDITKKASGRHDAPVHSARDKSKAGGDKSPCPVQETLHFNFLKIGRRWRRPISYH